MDHNFQDKQLIFLHQYFRDPTLPFSHISNNTGISQTTLKNYHQEFKHTEFLAADKYSKDNILGMRINSDVHAMLIPDKLNLKRVLFVIDKINPEMANDLITNLMNIPYIGRMWGTLVPNNTFVVEFVLPEVLIDRYNDLFVILKDVGYFQDEEMINATYLSHDSLNIQQNNIINFDKELDKIRENFSRFFLRKFDPIEIKDPDSQYDIVDIHLIRELEINGDLKLTSIAEFYDKDISTLSRRLKTIRNEYISCFRVNYDYEEIDLQYLMVTGSASAKITRVIYEMVKSRIFWFESFFYTDENQFVWEMKVSMKYFPVIKQFLNEICQVDNILILDNFTGQPSINPSLFDEDKGSWIIDPSLLKSILNHLHVNFLEKYSEIGKILDATIEQSRIDIYALLENKFFDLVDFIELLNKVPESIFSLRKVSKVLKTDHAYDKPLLMALLDIFGTDLTSEQQKYISNLIESIDRQNSMFDRTK